MAAISRTARGEARRAQILAAARACFLRNGFHATSMQDLLAAAELSAGAFYRYFPSKDAVVLAICTAAAAELSSVLDAETAKAPPGIAETLRRVIFAAEQLDAAHASAHMSVQLWAEAQRNPELARTVAEAMRPVLQWFEQVAEALQARGELSARVPARQVAMSLLGIVQGFVVQRVLVGMDAATYCAGLAVLQRSA
jgi:AcrR family transcriptional regulator